MNKKIIGAVAVAVLLATGVTACEGETKAPAESPAAVVPDGDANAPVEDEPVSATIPDFTGMNHQDAQDTAQAIGFYSLHEQDASGRGRMLFNDSNWQVCSQTPPPGVYFTDADIKLFSVKIGEVCP